MLSPSRRLVLPFGANSPSLLLCVASSHPAQASDALFTFPLVL